MQTSGKNGAVQPRRVRLAATQQITTTPPLGGARYRPSQRVNLFHISIHPSLQIPRLIFGKLASLVSRRRVPDRFIYFFKEKLSSLIFSFSKLKVGPFRTTPTNETSWVIQTDRCSFPICPTKRARQTPATVALQKASALSPAESDSYAAVDKLETAPK